MCPCITLSPLCASMMPRRPSGAHGRAPAPAPQAALHDAGARGDKQQRNKGSRALSGYGSRGLRAELSQGTWQRFIRAYGRAISGHMAELSQGIWQRFIRAYGRAISGHMAAEDRREAELSQGMEYHVLPLPLPPLLRQLSGSTVCSPQAPLPSMTGKASSAPDARQEGLPGWACFWALARVTCFE